MHGTSSFFPTGQWHRGCLNLGGQKWAAPPLPRTTLFCLGPAYLQRFFSQQIFLGQSEHPQRLTAAIRLLLGDTLATRPMVVVSLEACHQPLCCPGHSSFGPGWLLACPPVGERGFKGLEVPASECNLGVPFCLGNPGGNCIGALI